MANRNMRRGVNNFRILQLSNISFILGVSSEIIKCKECGQEFETIDSLKEHERSEQEEKELQNKGV
ncbi:MAG: hypothetical protein WAM14_23740 [Candidatus Nitrosopolaris sp.]